MRIHNILLAASALAITIVSGVMGGFPLRYLEPILCIQMIGADCQPFTILWGNFLLDAVVWLAVVVLIYKTLFATVKKWNK